MEGFSESWEETLQPVVTCRYGRLSASSKQAVVQVFISCIADGLVRHPFPIQSGNGFGRLLSGQVIVKVAMDVLVSVQPFQAFFQVVDGVQHHKVAWHFQTDRLVAFALQGHVGQEVHEALHHAAVGLHT